jgi:hypothetical protein
VDGSKDEDTQENEDGDKGDLPPVVEACLRMYVAQTCFCIRICQKTFDKDSLIYNISNHELSKFFNSS